MSKSIICTCPKCAHEFLFKSAAKRPRPHCPRCHFWFYAQNNTTQNTQEKPKKKKKDLEIKLTDLDFTMGLTEENIEKAITHMLVEGVTESKLRLAVDFYNKVRGTDLSRLEEPLDMEGFLLHEQSERKT